MLPDANESQIFDHVVTGYFANITNEPLFSRTAELATSYEELLKQPGALKVYVNDQRMPNRSRVVSLIASRRYSVLECRCAWIAFRGRWLAVPCD